jgi:GntR family transcriptional regulator, vanillate catabolism transcriptional regulator
MSQFETSRRPAGGLSNIGQVVIRLREMILKGNFEAGERIAELPLVALLGVSRTPIRLALERLAYEGLIQPNPTGGFVIRGFTLDDVWDSVELRGTLEGNAARLAAERIKSREDTAILRRIQDEMDSLGAPTAETLPTYLELNDAFHAEIVRLSRNSLLRVTLDHLFCLPFASPSALVNSPLEMHDGKHLVLVGKEHHHLLIDAIESGQGEFAESLAFEHSNLIKKHLDLAVGNTKILARVPGATLITIGDEGPKFNNGPS